MVLLLLFSEFYSDFDLAFSKPGLKITYLRTLIQSLGQELSPTDITLDSVDWLPFFFHLAQFALLFCSPLSIVSYADIYSPTFPSHLDKEPCRNTGVYHG